jgi:hypothetical protein
MTAASGTGKFRAPADWKSALQWRAQTLGFKNRGESKVGVGEGGCHCVTGRPLDKSVGKLPGDQGSRHREWHQG